MLSESIEFWPLVSTFDWSLVSILFALEFYSKRSAAQLINSKGFKVIKLTKVCSNYFFAAKHETGSTSNLKGYLPNEQYFTFALIWWNFTLCMCYELNKLFPCFMGFADGCIYASTSSSKTSEKFKTALFPSFLKATGKRRLTIDSMVNFSLRLVETSSSSSRIVLATSSFSFHV